MNVNNKVLRLILEQPQIQPNDILYALYLRGVTSTTIAADCDCKPQTVSQVVHGKAKSIDIATYIANKLDTTTRRLWGDAYDYTPRRTPQHSKVTANVQ